MKNNVSKFNKILKEKNPRSLDDFKHLINNSQIKICNMSIYDSKSIIYMMTANIENANEILIEIAKIIIYTKYLFMYNLM